MEVTNFCPVPPQLMVRPAVKSVATMPTLKSHPRFDPLDCPHTRPIMGSNVRQTNAKCNISRLMKAAVIAVEIASCDETGSPAGVIVGGWKAQLAPAGNPVHDREIALANPFCGVAVTVYVAG